MSWLGNGRGILLTICTGALLRHLMGMEKLLRPSGCHRTTTFTTHTLATVTCSQCVLMGNFKDRIEAKNGLRGVSTVVGS